MGVMGTPGGCVNESPFKHGNDVLISATTNRPVNEAGIKPHMYWCEVCKIKLTHAMSAIAHFSGTPHLSKAGFLKGDSEVQTVGVTNKRKITASVGAPPIIPAINNPPPTQAPPAKSIKINYGAASSGVNIALSSAQNSQSSIIGSHQLSDYYWSGASTNSGAGQNKSNNNVSGSISEMGNNAAPLPYTSSSYVNEQSSYGMSLYSSHSYEDIPEGSVKSYSYSDRQNRSNGTQNPNWSNLNKQYPLSTFTTGGAGKITTSYTNVNSRYGSNQDQYSGTSEFAPSYSAKTPGSRPLGGAQGSSDPKSVYCQSFNKTGTCPYGERCTFIHRQPPVCQYDQKCTIPDCGYFHNTKPDDDEKKNMLVERVEQLETIIKEMSSNSVDTNVLSKLVEELSSMKKSVL